MSEKSDTKPRRLGTVKEACRQGKFGHTKCYDYINKGMITAYKRGRQTLIDLDTVDALPLTPIPPKGAGW